SSPQRSGTGPQYRYLVGRRTGFSQHHQKPLSGGLVPLKQKDIRIDQDELQELLLGQWADDRRQMRKMMEEPVFHHQINLTKEEHRELTLNQLKELAA